MPQSINPSFVRINYHSVYGLHSMTLPTLQWNDVVSANNHGQFDTWDNVGIDAQDMIEALVTLLAPFFPDTLIFDNWIVFNKPVDPGPSYPQTAEALVSFEGSSGTPGWSQAVQTTISLRTEDFGISKLVLLDSASGNSFDKVLVPDTETAALIAEFTSTGNGWSGRDNSRPNSFISLTSTLNEKLRRAYRMT